MKPDLSFRFFRRTHEFTYSIKDNLGIFAMVSLLRYHDIIGSQDSKIIQKKRW